jgi:hypothetical protein
MKVVESRRLNAGRIASVNTPMIGLFMGVLSRMRSACPPHHHDDPLPHEFHFQNASDFAAKSSAHELNGSFGEVISIH